jgi:hypothetical protein
MRGSMVVALALCACSRELTLPGDGAPPLAIVPAFASVAPREKLTLQAQGGQPPYRFAFAEGGSLSGVGAALDSAGNYQAGRGGSAQDVLQVTDGAGSVRQARIAVGPRLSANPVFASTSPGGFVPVTVTGGKPPYTFSIDHSDNVQLERAEDGAVLVFGSDGDYLSKLTIGDQTGDADAATGVFIQVTSALRLLAPGADQLAPFGTLDFIATGGHPPYTFCLKEQTPQAGACSSGLAAINVTTGHFEAGDAAVIVTVTDSAIPLKQSASLPVALLPGLAAHLETSDLHPGVPLHVLASGGKPPYVFGFSAKGNRSQGTIDAVTGLYTPGLNYGANDIIEVRDATHVREPPRNALATVIAPPVGALLLPAAPGDRCFAADLNGDGVDDVVIATTRRLGAFAPTLQLDLSQPGGLFRVVSGGASPTLADLLHTDLNGDSREDLVLLDGGQLQYLLANSDGTLAPPVTGYVRAAGSSGPADTLAGAWDANGARFASFAYEKAGLCGPGKQGVVLSAWNTPSAANPGGGPTPAGCVLTLTQAPIALFAGDFNGDGLADLTWIEAADPSTLKFLMSPLPALPGTPAAAPTFAVPLGADVAFPASGDPVSQRAAAVDLNADGKDDLLLAVVRSGEAGVVEVLGAAGVAPQAGGFYDPFPSGIQGSLAGFTLVRGAAGELTFTAWDGIDGLLVSFAPDFTPRPQPPDPNAAVACAAAPDANGDGIPDLLTTNPFLKQNKLLWGEGDGRYGVRSHFKIGIPANSADVDGDGVEDMLMGTPAPAVRVAWGGAHQIAYGPETVLPFPAQSLVPGRFHGPGSPVDLLIQSSEFSLYLADGAPDGTFGVPQLLREGADPAPQVDLFDVADLGGAAKGPDLLIFYRSPAPAFEAWVRESDLDPTQVQRFSLPPLTGYPECDFVAVDLDGDGLTDVAVACRPSGTHDLRFLISRASRPGGVLQFSAWVPAAASVTGATSVEWQAVGADVRRAVFAVTAISAASTTAAYSIGLGGGGAPAAVRSAVASRAAFGSYALDTMDGDAVKDLLFLENRRLQLFHGDGTGGFVAPRLFSAPQGRVFTLNLTGGQSDAIVLLDSEEEVVVLQNDGQGGLP